MSNAYQRSLLPIIACAVVAVACSSAKPVPPADVAPVLGAVVRAVDSVVGQTDAFAIDPRILPTRSSLGRKQVSTVWSEGELSRAISPRHPRLDLGKMAFTCPVGTPGCVATKDRPVIVLSMPVLARDTAVVEARYANRSSDDMINEVHLAWFAVRKDSSWRVVKHTTLDKT
jgi:hypothetical protein